MATVATVVMWLVAFYLGFWIFWRMAASIRFASLADAAATEHQAKEQEATRTTR